VKKTSRFLISAGCILLLLVSWVLAATAKSDADRQLALIYAARENINSGIFVRAVPLLEEAAGLSSTHLDAAEKELKYTYLALVETTGFRRKYIDLLEKQMSRTTAHPDIFIEAAEYYLVLSKIPDALNVLRKGLIKTGDEDVNALYEKHRYAYETNRTAYDFAAAINETKAQVQIGGLWGLAESDGVLLIPCEYEKVSTFSADRVIVKKDGEIYAVNEDNNRVAKLSEQASDFDNFAGNRVSLLIDQNWYRASGDLIVGTSSFEQIGMYSAGYAAAKTGGKWGVIDLGTGWYVPAEYDGIISDELGRCFARGAVFARRGDRVYLLIRGQETGDVFDDARPFSNEGYAAVKKEGKWGYIDLDGTVTVDFMFDEALSFGQHLAAVKLGEYWGYISLYGRVVIEPVFFDAKSFSNGSAPVLTERGWQFITLLELKGG